MSRPKGNAPCTKKDCKQYEEDAESFGDTCSLCRRFHRDMYVQKDPQILCKHCGEPKEKHLKYQNSMRTEFWCDPSRQTKFEPAEQKSNGE